MMRTLPALAILLVSHAASAGDAGFESVKISRTSCEGFCPVYTVEVRSDGLAKFTGNDYVRVTGAREKTLSKSDLSLLSAILERVQLFQLKDRYERTVDGCAHNVTFDIPGVIIEFQQGHKHKSIRANFACDGRLEDLHTIAWVADSIDEIVGTEQWVRPNPAL